MDRTYAGAESGLGAVYEWSGKLKAGSGRMEIVDAVDDERVVIDQRNPKPFRSEATTTYLQVHGPDGRSQNGLARLKADAEAARPSPTGTDRARSSPATHPALGEMIAGVRPPNEARVGSIRAAACR